MAAPHDNKGIEEILDNEGTTTGAIILGALMTTATHPLTCVRVLMQVCAYVSRLILKMN